MHIQYYSKALAHPLGQRVFAFYTSTSKQVLDIHEEARRIAEQQKAAASASAPGSATGTGAPPYGVSEPTAGGSEKAPEPTTQAAPTVV